MSGRRPRFVMTPSGRIMLRVDYEREQQQIRDWAAYERREQMQRDWRAARAATAGTAPGEQCGTDDCTNDARWIPIAEGNAGGRTYRCVACCDAIAESAAL